MKRQSLYLASCLTACSAFAMPTVVENSVSAVQGEDRKVTISYQLSGEPAVVTIDIQTNTLEDATGEWKSIGGEALSYMVGDVNRVVKKVGETARAVWYPHKAWPNNGIVKNVRAEVTAWATNAPPDYMVVDLGCPSNVTFYASADAVPGSVTTDMYKLTKLLMRKIPAAGVIWTMGSVIGGTDWEAKHQVTFSDDYYMGVFELTQGQYSLIDSNNPSTYQSPKKPLESLRYDFMRGAYGSCSWPTHGSNVGERMLKFRNRTGLLLDYPTDAQWEYACRAGNGGEHGTTWDALRPIAWSKLNWTDDPALTANQPHEVGLLAPNDWGLYDTIGNVFEFVLEGNYTPDLKAPGTPLVDPTCTVNETVSKTKCIVLRGGSYSSDNLAWFKITTRKTSNDPWSSNAMFGFRLCAPAAIGY